ncbi:TPA: hypothetical protein N0F65_000469 [Lagenidium giganteum]|uniref:Uncharacterized protein n=1 Tax=Lagenidium giganteum TaxID=4803 RepID=A0AAV2YYQ6_9STRA|nr:TPA: hypothetical protein N0F65_000469 [Lagenidium giganteum]
MKSCCHGRDTWFKLDASAPTFRDTVLATGTAASLTVQALLSSHNMTAKSSGPALKAFRLLQRRGCFDGKSLRTIVV